MNVPSYRDPYIQSHYEQDCLHYPLPCQQCGEPVSRRDVQQHIDESCKLVRCQICEGLVSFTVLKFADYLPRIHGTFMCMYEPVHCMYITST